MNVPPYEVVDAPTRPLDVERLNEPRARTSDADWERGVNLFILAAATFFRSAAKAPHRSGRPPSPKDPPSRKPSLAARKRRAGPAAKRSSAKQ